MRTHARGRARTAKYSHALHRRFVLTRIAHAERSHALVFARTCTVVHAHGRSRESVTTMTRDRDMRVCIEYVLISHGLT